ncbi:MAG: Ig-like domain-containing protein [Chitinophagaceae bacterium]
MIRLLFFLFILFFLIQQIVVLPGCATIIPPEGGPKDTLPPVLRRANPLDSSRDFTSKTITLSFDEYVDADNYQQDLIVSPVPANMPTVTRKLNTVTIKLRDTIEANTTYSFNFGNTIKDVNEGNIIKDFTYTFSSGPYFDSLRFSGNVVLAETGEIDSTLTIMLHQTNIDSALIKQKPRYIAKTDGEGNFRFKNLPPDTFYVYALKDEGGSYRYLNKSQLFAFVDSAVIVTNNTKPITLYAYATKETPIITNAASTSTANKKPADKRLKFSTNLSGNEQDLLDKFVITFENKLKNFDSAKVHFSRDTTFTPITDYNWNLDSTRKKLTLNYIWPENILYHVIVEKDFATDTLGQQLLKPDTISFTTKERKDYGRLTLRFRNLDLTKNPVLLFVQNNEVKKSFPLTSTTFSQTLFPPGEYSLRILNDANKNGIWDEGDFFGKRKQPELVKPIQRTINVKAGLDTPVEIDVTAPPAPTRSQPSQNPASPGRPNNRPTNRPANRNN